jgi:catechol 2,3-dioxygenase-like lactoylglutathione lyase family enzyme
MTDPDHHALPGITGLGQVGLLVRDAARAEAFYRDVLELRHLFTFGTLAFFDLDGVRLMLSQPEDGVWRPGSVLYLRVPDIEAAHGALAARGVPFDAAPHLIHRHADGIEEWMAFFRDPDENQLALMARVAPTPS